MSRYTVYVTPTAWVEIKALPGHVRSRVRQSIDLLAVSPRPSNSKSLVAPDIELELRRIRLDRWRIFYAVWDGRLTVDILAVRKRPPYDYGDLEQLVAVIG